MRKTAKLVTEIEIGIKLAIAVLFLKVVIIGLVDGAVHGGGASSSVATSSASRTLFTGLGEAIGESIAAGIRAAYYTFIIIGCYFVGSTIVGLVCYYLVFKRAGAKLGKQYAIILIASTAAIAGGVLLLRCKPEEFDVNISDDKNKEENKEKEEEKLWEKPLK